MDTSGLFLESVKLFVSSSFVIGSIIYIYAVDSADESKQVTGDKL